MSGAEALVGVFRDVSAIPWLRIVALVIAAWAMVQVLAWLLPRVAETLPARLRLRLLPLVPALRLAITVTVVLTVAPMIIAPTPQNIVALLGALGIAIGFAFKDYASSLVAGVVAVAEAPYRQGDWVRVGDAYGEVRSIGLRAFELVTPSDDVVTVPHEHLWTGQVANSNDGDRTLMVVASVWLEPDHDGTRLRERLLEVAWTSPWLDPSRPVAVVACEDPWGTRYDIKAYPLEARDQFAFRTDLTIRTKEVVAAEGARFARAAVTERSGGG